MANREDVMKAVERLMNGEEEAERRRQRATEFGKKARQVMNEEGTSFVNMTSLIQYFTVKSNENDEGN